MVRDYVKWDDTPVTLTHFAESAVRAYKIATTVPMEPVVIVADGELQEEPITEKNLRQYRKLFDEYQERVQTYCNRHSLGCTRAATTVTFDELILRMMRQAGAVR